MLPLVWRNGKRTASRAPGALARWGFESPLQHLAREWCNRQTRRPQKAVLVSSNLTSRIYFRRPRRAWPKRQRRLSQKESRCGFDSRRAHRSARVAQAGRGGGLKPRRLRVRVSPRASAFGTEGVYANGQSGLSFKQAAPRLCGFEPRHPCQNAFALAVAQTGRAPHCECGNCGFESRRPTFHITRGVSQARTKARDSLSRRRGFESRTPCQSFEPGTEAHV